MGAVRLDDETDLKLMPGESLLANWKPEFGPFSQRSEVLYLTTMLFLSPFTFLDLAAAWDALGGVGA